MPVSQKELNMSQELSTDLQGTVMIVTGAGRGIGKEISTMAALRGAQVALLEINAENLDRSVAQIRALGGDVKGYRIDLCNESEIISVLTEIETEFGRIDCLVNNAITTGAEELLETTSDDWNQMVRIVMTAPFLCIKQLLPGMIARGSGNIINIGTVNARVMLGSDAYSVAKAGVHALTRSVAVRYGPSGIRCNTVVPGTIATDVWQERVERNPQVFEDLKPWYPVGRVGLPRDIAEAVLYLASSRSAFMSGSEMVVDGGLLAGPAPMFKIIEAQG
jgi:meso-butanediol dehydrogenase/(S,S)-butanediol dehydrogenase/diacetyl reductase